MIHRCLNCCLDRGEVTAAIWTDHVRLGQTRRYSSSNNQGTQGSDANPAPRPTQGSPFPNPLQVMSWLPWTTHLITRACRSICCEPSARRTRMCLSSIVVFRVDRKKDNRYEGAGPKRAHRAPRLHNLGAVWARTRASLVHDSAPPAVRHFSSVRTQDGSPTATSPLRSQAPGSSRESHRVLSPRRHQRPRS